MFNNVLEKNGLIFQVSSQRVPNPTTLTAFHFSDTLYGQTPPTLAAPKIIYSQFHLGTSTTEIQTNTNLQNIQASEKQLKQENAPPQGTIHRQHHTSGRMNFGTVRFAAAYFPALCQEIDRSNRSLSSEKKEGIPYKFA